MIREVRCDSAIEPAAQISQPVPLISQIATRSLSIWRDLRTILLMLSIMWTGMRMVRAWSAIERVTACRIHQVA